MTQGVQLCFENQGFRNSGSGFRVTGLGVEFYLGVWVESEVWEFTRTDD